MSSEGEQILDEIREDLLVKLSLPENTELKKRLIEKLGPGINEDGYDLFYLDSDEFKTNDFTAIPRNAVIDIVNYDDEIIGEIKVHINMNDAWFSRNRNSVETYDYSDPIESIEIDGIEIFV